MIYEKILFLYFLGGKFESSPQPQTVENELHASDYWIIVSKYTGTVLVILIANTIRIYFGGCILAVE